MRIKASSKTDVGRKRPHNEDTLRIAEDLRLYIVCDGMGGHAAGEVASRVAAEAFEQQVRERYDELSAAASGDRDRRRYALEMLGQAAQHANHVVHSMAEENDAQRGMGTTLTAMLVVNHRAFVTHVGDSRLYLKRNDQVHQVTSDHTILNEMVRAGRVKADDARAVKHLNALTRAVGVYPNVEPETTEVDVLPGDMFLLCSDGLHNYLDGFDLLTFLEHTELETAADDLVAWANKRGGADNITVVVLSARDAAETQETLRIRLTLKTLRQIPLFQYLSFAELLKVIQVCELVERDEGVTLMAEGEYGEKLYIVVRGAVVVHTGDTEIATLTAGRHVGEMSLIDNRPRSASVSTVEKSLLIEISRDNFYELMRSDSVLAVKLLWNFIQTLTNVVRSIKHEPGIRGAGERTLQHPYE